MPFSGIGQPLTPPDLANAVQALGLDPASGLPVLWSVLTVESRGFGFLAPTRQPKILFERHIFFRETDGAFEGVAPDLCNKTGGGYEGGAAEYERLSRAIALCKNRGLDVECALRSASWGLGQVMGFNAARAGFSTAADMAGQMAASEGAQLDGMVNFMKSQKLDVSLREKDWTGFAKKYNGAAYWKNQYDVKLKMAYGKFSSGVERDLRARAAQGALQYLNFNPGDPDGVIGQNTRRAILAYRAKHGLPGDDNLDPAVFASLMKAAGLTWPDP